MDVFCLPSLREALGIVLLEAQYNGLPCVVSDVVPKEVEVSNGITRVNLNTSTQEWTKVLLSRVEKRNHIECAKSQFDINETYPQLQTLYKG